MQLPNFSPPNYQELSGDLNSRVKHFAQYWPTYSQYLFNYLNKLKTAIQLGVSGSTPFQSIASAVTITPLQQIQPVTGSISVATINAPTDVGFIVLLAVDGFSTLTTGNIAAAVTLAAGTGRPFYLHFKTLKWYPS